MIDATKQLELLLADVLHEWSFELDMHYEDEAIAKLADNDSTFIVFRRALRELQARNMKVSDRVLHIQRKVERVYREAFSKPLPTLDEGKASDTSA